MVFIPNNLCSYLINLNNDELIIIINFYYFQRITIVLPGSLKKGTPTQLTSRMLELLR